MHNKRQKSKERIKRIENIKINEYSTLNKAVAPGKKLKNNKRTPMFIPDSRVCTNLLNCRYARRYSCACALCIGSFNQHIMCMKVSYNLVETQVHKNKNIISKRISSHCDWQTRGLEGLNVNAIKIIKLDRYC